MVRQLLQRRVPFVLLAALHAPGRTGLAVAGTAFAVFLILAELLFDSTVAYTAGAIWKRLDFDLMLVSSGFREVVMSAPFPRQRLVQALDFPGVARVSPVWRANAAWKDREAGTQGRIVVIGVRPEDRPLRLPEAEELALALEAPDAVAADRESLRVCGPMERGREATCVRRKVRISTLVSIGVGFVCDGAVLASEQNFERITESDLENVHLGLITLAPGAEGAAVAAALRAGLPPDVQVLTPAELDRAQREFWERISSSGKITRAGVALALVVALVVLVQILSTEVLKRLPEFATLAALGYERRAIRGMVLRHALALALGGYALGLLAALPLPRLLGRLVHMPLAHSPRDAALVLAATVLVCLLAASFALRSLERADPAELF
jgi:putative ABC transport system permease protein